MPSPTRSLSFPPCYSTSIGRAGGRTQMAVNETQLCISLTSDINSTISQLSQCLAKIINHWLTLKPGKPEIMLMRRENFCKELLSPVTSPCIEGTCPQIVRANNKLQLLLGSSILLDDQKSCCHKKHFHL